MKSIDKKILVFLIADIFLFLLFLLAIHQNPLFFYESKEPIFKEKITFEKSFELKEQNDSGQSGNVVFKEVGESVVVQVKIDNFTPGVIQPGYVYKGSCENLGEEVFQLASVRDGQSTITWYTLDIKEVREKQPFSVGILEKEGKGLVSCGEIEL